MNFKLTGKLFINILVLELISSCALVSNPTWSAHSKSINTTTFVMFIDSRLLEDSKQENGGYSSYRAKEILDLEYEGMETCSPREEISFRDPGGPTVTVIFDCPKEIMFPYTEARPSYQGAYGIYYCLFSKNGG